MIKAALHPYLFSMEWVLPGSYTQIDYIYYIHYLPEVSKTLVNGHVLPTD